MRVEIVEPKLFAGTIADELVALIGEAVEERGVCTMALAGGKTPGQVYRSLSLPPRVQDISWEKVKLFLGDERWVSHDDSHSNFRMVNEALLSHLRGAKPKVFNVDTNQSSAAEGAALYASTIEREVPKGPSGYPTIDIMILGLGEDGHTASLFPGSELLRSDPNVFCGYAKNPHDNSDRVTMLPSLIKAARSVMFIVKGMNKAEIVRQILEGSDSDERYPARMYVDIADKVTWFLDSEAASKIDAGKFS